MNNNREIFLGNLKKFYPEDSVMLFVAHLKTTALGIIEHFSKERDIPDMTNKQMVKYLKRKLNGKWIH